MNRKLKSLMIAKGVKQADIARQMGITRGTVSGAVGGFHQSDAVMQKLAEMLGLPHEKLEALYTRRPARKAHQKKAA